MNINYKFNKGMLSELDTNEVIALCLTPELEMDGAIKEMEDAFGLGTIIKNKYPEGIAEDIYFINEDRFLLPVVQTRDTFDKSLAQMCNFIIEKGINKVNMYRLGAGRTNIPWENTESKLKVLLKGYDVDINIYINN